jgi:UTP-glucose-1-phosphate uridylyltransferase
VLGLAALRPHIWGGKGVGSQGDGTAQLLARSATDQQAAIEIIQRDLGLPCLALTLRPGQSVRKAVIPAAGFGTRLFPASRVTKKELFPVIDRDGIAKPVILLIVEEALAAGVDQVIVIVQQHDLPAFQSLFDGPVTIENYNKLPRSSQDYARRILEIGRQITWVVQPAQEGFGHAVYCAREAVGNEPFLLLLGDHLYRSYTDRPCARQIVDAFEQHGLSVLGLRRTPEEQIGNFGTVTGIWQDEGRLLNLTEFAEKPTVDYARAHLRVEGVPEGEYLTVFGQYVIKPQVFGYLEEHITNNVRQRGEFQLTSALDRLRKEDGLLGLMVEGRRYDIGLPEFYLETLRTFALP